MPFLDIMGETKIWEGRPSQWVNVLHFALVATVVWAPIAVWHWLSIRCTEYVLSDQRLIPKYGVLSRQEDEIELFRVKDTRFAQPFLMRLVSFANIKLVTSDALQKNQLIRAVPNARALREQLRSAVDKQRTHKNVHEVDYA